MTIQISYTEGQINPRTEEQFDFVSVLNKMQSEVAAASRIDNPLYDGKIRFRRTEISHKPYFTDKEAAAKKGFSAKHEGVLLNEVETPTHKAFRSAIENGVCTWTILEK